MLEYLSLLAPVSVVYFVLLARRLPAAPRGEYSWPDAGLALLLIGWFGLTISDSLGKKMVITPGAIHLGIILYACLVILIVGFLVFRNKNPIRLWGLHWPGWRPGLGLVLLSLVLVYPALLAALYLTQKAVGSSAPQDVVEYLLSHKQWGDRLTFIFMAVVAAPIAEETIFRGYLHGVFRNYAGRWPAALINSALFAAIHGHIPALPPLFLLALAFTIVYEHTRSLWASIAMHSVFNIITVIAALFFPRII